MVDQFDKAVLATKLPQRESRNNEPLSRPLTTGVFKQMGSPEELFSQSQVSEENAFVLNNYDIIEQNRIKQMNLITYLVNSFFDNEYYHIKRKKLVEYNDDISNKEQTMLQSCQHEGLSRYVMSFYLNRSIYIFLSASQNSLQKLLPIKNQVKALGLYLQICKGVKYLHDKNLVFGVFNSSTIFIQKNKAFLAMNTVYDVNKYGPQNSFSEKKVLVTNQQYLPPEDYFSPQGDVWSLAILLHEIITGLLPYHKKDGRFQILEDCIDPFLAKILQRALRRDPLIRTKLPDLIVDVENFMNNYRTTETSLASFNIQNPDVQMQDNYNNFLQDITLSTIHQEQDDTVLTKASVSNDIQALEVHYQQNGYPKSKLGRVEIDLHVPLQQKVNQHLMKPQSQQGKPIEQDKVKPAKATMQKSQSSAYYKKVQVYNKKIICQQKTDQSSTFLTANHGNRSGAASSLRTLKKQSSEYQVSSPKVMIKQKHPRHNSQMDFTGTYRKAEGILTCINIDSQMINLNEKQIDDETLPLILNEVQSKNHNLRILSLNNNLIGNKGCYSLAEFIPKLQNLEILYLKNNNISDEGGLALTDAIVGSQTLQLINLYGNHLGNISVERLIKCLIANNHPIKCINLEKNCLDKAQLQKNGIDIACQRFKV